MRGLWLVAASLGTLGVVAAGCGIGTNSENETICQVPSDDDGLQFRCTSEPEDWGDGDGDGDGDWDSGDTSDDDAGSDGAEPEPEPEEVPPATCRAPCQQRSDCATDEPGDDEDNWLCIDGGCIPTGCWGDDDCGESERCLPGEPGGWGGSCVTACEAAGDCGTGLGPDIEANYDCIEGACVFRGCGTDLECQALDAGLGCFPHLAADCLETCQDPGGCGSGLSDDDADNYECVLGACVFLGCNGDDECLDGGVCVAPPLPTAG